MPSLETAQYPFRPAGTDPFNPGKMMTRMTLDEAPGLVLFKEKELFKADPIGIIRAGFLKIKNKEGDLVSFKPNKIQMQVIKVIQAQRAKRLPVRIAILKGRQFGISTLCEAICYVFSTQRAYGNSMVVADDQEGADRLMDMTRLFQEKMREEQPHLTPVALKDNITQLEFKNKRSMILIETAGKRKKVGRKFTLRVAHGSETAFWPAFSDSHTSLSQSVPEKPETIILYETTANGINDFCKFWRRIKTLNATGQTPWIPLFLSWKDHDEYSKTFASDEERAKFVESLSKEEQDIQTTHGLAHEQMNWRRWKIDNDFAGDAESFAVEFPLDDNEAFRSTGKAVFAETLLKAQDALVETPKLIGEVEFAEKRALFMPYKNGDLKVWDGPKAGHRYLIGADACESAAGHDFCSFQVIDLTVKRQVAEFHARIPPDQLAKKIFAAGAWYNWAQVIPETNGPGMVVVSKLKDMYYPNIYRRHKMVVTDYGVNEETEEFGWHTNVKTKPHLIEAGREAFRTMAIQVRSAGLMDELRTFVVKDVSEDGHVRYGAEDGFYDDRVIAFLIALYVGQNYAGVSNETSQRMEGVPSGKTGY